MCRMAKNNPKLHTFRPNMRKKELVEMGKLISFLYVRESENNAEFFGSAFDRLTPYVDCKIYAHGPCPNLIDCLGNDIPKNDLLPTRPVGTTPATTIPTTTIPTTIAPTTPATMRTTEEATITPSGRSGEKRKRDEQTDAGEPCMKMRRILKEPLKQLIIRRVKDNSVARDIVFKRRKCDVSYTWTRDMFDDEMKDKTALTYGKYTI